MRDGVADRAAGKRVILARLLRFRLGADKSPAPSAQALHTGQSDALPIGRLRRNPIRAALAFGAGVPGGVVAGGVNARADAHGLPPCEHWLFQRPNRFTQSLRPDSR